MQSVLIILIFIALLALAFFAKMRRLRRATTEIIESFRQHGAVREKRAMTLEQVGLHSKPKYPFLVRDPKVEALSQLLNRGLIIPVSREGNEEVKYYLNEQSIA